MATFPEELSPDRIGPAQPLGGDQKQIGAPGQSFQSFMQSTSGTPQGIGGVPSPFDLSQGQALIPGKPTLGTLLAQINGAQQAMGDLANNLSTPNLKLNRAQRYLVGNKLSDARSYMRSVGSKLGVEEPPPQELPPGATPIAKFLAMLSDGQYQLQSAQSQLQGMNDVNKPIHPADMLLMQVKLNKAQVEIEYTSVLVSNAVNAMKQLFGIQI